MIIQGVHVEVPPTASATVRVSLDPDVVGLDLTGCTFLCYEESYSSGSQADDNTSFDGRAPEASGCVFGSGSNVGDDLV